MPYKSRRWKTIKFACYLVALCVSIYTFIILVSFDENYYTDVTDMPERTLHRKHSIADRHLQEYAYSKGDHFEIVNDSGIKMVMNDSGIKIVKKEKPVKRVRAVVDDPVLVNQFLTLRSTRQFLYDHYVLIPSRRTCTTEEPALVILCLTKHENIEQRNAIRETWGSIATKQTWPLDNRIFADIKFVFLLGRHSNNDKTKQVLLEKESRTYGDIVQIDFTDSYYNLTIKVLSGLRWVYTYCPRTKFILKADDDTFIHVKNLLDYLTTLAVPQDGVVIGHALPRARVVRFGKWKIDTKMYPFNYYPIYTSGNTYVISGNLIPKLLLAAEYMPYISIEDAFITGILRLIVGAYIIDKEGFTNANDLTPRICSFHNRVRISATKVTPSTNLDLWTVLNMTLTNCYVPRKGMTTFVVDTDYLKRAKVLTQTSANQYVENGDNQKK